MLTNRTDQKASRRSAWARAGGTAAVALTALGAIWLMQRPGLAETAKPMPLPAVDEPVMAGSETITVAGGCFWGVQGVFQHVKGVTRAVSGYAGGSKTAPSYEEVSSGDTGHAESVQITYDPRVVSTGTILRIFFSVALDPTQRDRQGPDYGTQYRSAIFAETEAQKKIAEAYIAQLDKAHLFSVPIATTVGTGTRFYPAEGYHQDYATLHPDSGYIAMNDLPKIDALRRLFPQGYQAKPVLVASSGSTN